MRNKMPYHSWSRAWNLKNCFLPSQLENMTNSEKPPFESENKVGYVSFCFETRLPNYLVGLKKKKTFQMQNLILEINCFPRMTTHHTAGCSYYNREAAAAGWARPAAMPPSVPVWMCTLTERSQAHLPAISVGLSSSHHSGCVQWFPGTKHKLLKTTKSPTHLNRFSTRFSKAPLLWIIFRAKYITPCCLCIMTSLWMIPECIYSHLLQQVPLSVFPTTGWAEGPWINKFKAKLINFIPQLLISSTLANCTTIHFDAQSMNLTFVRDSPLLHCLSSLPASAFPQGLGFISDSNFLPN